MNPAQAIVALDRQLADHGQNVSLQRYPDGDDVPVALACRALVRGFQADELVAGIEQTDSKFIMSPSQIVAAGAAWPGAAGGEPWPQVGDWLEVLGRRRRIEAAAPIVLADVVVRIEGRVRG